MDSLKTFAFKSSFGYNCTVREGKIYKFSSSEMLGYLIEVNIDLIEILSILRIHFKKYLKNYIICKRFLKKIKIPRDLLKRELGILNFSNIYNNIKYEYENKNINNTN